MRIKIACSNNSTYSLPDFEPKLSVLASMSDNTISSFSSIKRFVNNMSGGVGVLQGALDLLDARLAFEESRKNDLINMHDKVTDFVGIVKKVDSAVSERVSTSQNEFYDVHPWAKPSALSVTLDSWYNCAQNWLKSALKRTADAIDHVWNVYNETDYRALSDKELQKVCDDYLRLIESKSLTNDDKIRLQSLLNYLSTANVFETPLRRNEKIDLYVKVYEKLHPDEAGKMQVLFSNAPAEFEGDIRNIKFTAYKSTGECHDTFFRYADRIKIADYYATYNGEPGNYFNSQNMSMYLNIKSMRDRNNSYGTFFHEAGHNIDLLMGMDATGNKEWYSSSVLSNGDFHVLVYKDVEDIITNFVNNYSNNEKYLSDEQKSLITDVLMGRELDSRINNSDTDFAYRKVLEDITGAWKGKYSRQYQDGREVGILETKNSGMLSEVMNGMTNNSLMVNGKYSGNVNKIMGGFFGQAHTTSGHPTNWQNPRAGYVPTNYYYNSDGSYTGSAETEYMAEYMRINITNSTAEKDYVMRYLRNSWNVMSDGLND